MKKIILVLALVAFAATSVAQETPKKPSFSGFVSNKFWDNWELSIGAGIGTALSTGDDYGQRKDRLGFQADFSVTKWLHPVYGARLQLQGGKFQNMNVEHDKFKWPYIFVHTDFMLNFSNWVGGYRDDRAYYAVPYVGFGYLATNFTDKSHEDNMSGTHQTFAFAFGLQNRFRLSKSFDFNLELKGMLAPSRVSPIHMPGRYMFGFSATAGFTYRFNKRTWERGVPGYTAADIKAFQDAVAAGVAATAAAQADNARLSDELAAAKAAADAAAADAARARAAAAAAAANAKNNAPTSTIFYDYSVSKLNAKDKTRLELMADLIKDGPKDKVYSIEGHADQQTGTAAGNKRVAENRAKYVYDYLVKLGVNPNQLTYEGKGNEPDIYKNQKANRAAIIK
ncbi:OmpA family protein [uncultured Alistipes sp.]|jgi:hypothetical protein|uniref:OmpA family protein n=1 Tax=uncultured Alistipes sp. TaxID=538949 RepID=UPI0025DF908F|nr:OmpA family protein [uncultured Alistipes sp.]